MCSHPQNRLSHKFYFIMATRSRIGIQLEDDSILSVYHHWDGYPAWLGQILQTHYNTKEKVADLIDGGNMSSCWSDNVYDYEKQEYVKRDPQPEYYGGDDETPQLHKTMTEYFDCSNDCWGEYAYIFNKGEWFCYNTSDNLGALVDIPEEE